jgi:hypothetical protein
MKKYLAVAGSDYEFCNTRFLSAQYAASMGWPCDQRSMAR